MCVRVVPEQTHCVSWLDVAGKSCSCLGRFVFVILCFRCMLYRCFLFLVVSDSAIDCLETTRLSEMTC